MNQLVERKIVNLTPHAINLIMPSGWTHVIEPSGKVARVSSVTSVMTQLTIGNDQFPINQSSFGDVTDLPEPQDGVLFVVSMLVAQTPLGKSRPDIISPDTSPASVVRDEKGLIIGVRAFQKF